MTVLAIDPGNERSAFVEFDGTTILDRGIGDNDAVLKIITARRRVARVTHLAVEMIASYGMAVGREVFDTCVWIGRYIQAWDGPHTLVYRRDVKLHLCGQARAKDANIRAALIDRFGPGKERAIGKVKTPGPLYGVVADQWAALAVAVTYTDGARLAGAEASHA